MFLALIFAGLTGFFVSKKRWGSATFCGMMFAYFLWLNLLGMLTALFFRGLSVR